MIEESSVDLEIGEFLRNWTEEPHCVREYFSFFFGKLRAMPGVQLTFSARPGVSYSLRSHSGQSVGRDFFAIIDVVDDEPQNRWISFCFYEDLITDPEKRGECIPGGLPGGDGYCFNVNGKDDGLADYLVERLHEARLAAETGSA